MNRPDSELDKSSLVVASEVSPVPSEYIVVDVDEAKLLVLRDHALVLWQRYGDLLSTKADRIGPNAAIPPRVFYTREFELRAGFEFTQFVIKSLMEGTSVQLRPEMDPESGEVKFVHYEARKSGSNLGRTGFTNFPQYMFEMVGQLGVDQRSSSQTVQGVILRPTFTMDGSRRAELTNLTSLSLSSSSNRNLLV